MDMTCVFVSAVGEYLVLVDVEDGMSNNLNHELYIWVRSLDHVIIHGIDSDLCMEERVVLNVQRILNLKNDPQDPLDDISEDFNPAQILNVFFPDGVFLSISLSLPQLSPICAEESLGQIASVQAHLSKTEAELQKEILELQDEMSRNKDPNRMQLIQEMISVRPPSPPVSFHCKNTYPSRTFFRKYPLSGKRPQNQKQ